MSKSFTFPLAALMLTAISAFCLTLQQSWAHVVGWIGLVLFGSCFLASLAELFRPSHQITVDGSGITHNRWRFGTVPWDDIEQVWIGSMQSARFLCLKFREPGIYLNKLSPAKRKLESFNRDSGLGDSLISFQGFKPGLDEVWSYILTIHPEKTTTAPPKA